MVQYMKIYRIAQINSFDDAASAISDEYSNILSEYYRVKGKRGKPSPHMSWKVIPFSRLKKIWVDYAKTGVVRDISGMDGIKSQLLGILAKLQAANDLSWHGSTSDEEIFESTGIITRPESRAICKVVSV